ncbi:tripartite tricarboxylate transporter TctB family protein [Orrella sp. JC864]|uniref:tripartite tricarboxylate transporter TctB family protein n=1 Tax=Orrella sp. JC864 TaxID=3120298 RepID=UPI00300B08BA
MKVHDLFVGLFFVALGALVCGYAGSLPAPRHVDYGPGLFPAIVGAGLTATGLAIALKSLATLRTAVWWVRPQWSRSRLLALRFWSILLALPIYILLADTLGFLPTSTLIMTAMLRLRGVPLARAVLVALVVSLALTLLFASLLGVPLPWGPLTDISEYLIW